MDYAACNIVLVDRAAAEDKLVRRDDVLASPVSTGPPATVDSLAEQVCERANLMETNLQTLLETFNEVHVCRTAQSCMFTLSELNRISTPDLIPTLVLIDIPYDEQLNDKPARQVRTPSPCSTLQTLERAHDEDEGEVYGLRLLQWIATEIQYQSLSKLVVPVALVALPDTLIEAAPPRGRRRSRPALTDESLLSTKGKKHALRSLDLVRTTTFLDSGAVDALTSPLLHERLPGLAIHAYRAHKDASRVQRAMIDLKRDRKRSWVGLDDQKPYAYLREAMVSGLMDGICKLGGQDEPLGSVRMSVALDRRELIATAIGSWRFSAHDFTDDELLHAALLILQHALSMPELERWRLSTEQLTGFLIASRSAYNAFVPYHNFRHVIDVLQAVFHFLVKLGRLPEYPASTNGPVMEESPSMSALIRPFDALTLLITAIGHDVGHPGVNNAFLVTLNAPLAQLYNDRSVLESFHCAAYSQILRRHWPAAFQGVEMRQLMISSILATDMGLHFDYMKKLGYAQERLFENKSMDGLNGRQIDEQRTLACSLLIKCADISNVARNFDVATRWTEILTDEFARQATMEQDLGIPSALFAAPVREIIELGKSQLGFMNMFAIPLFQGVTDVMPPMQYCVDELHRNKRGWEQKVAEEQAKRRLEAEESCQEGALSPRAMTLTLPHEHRQPSPSISSLRVQAMLNKTNSRIHSSMHDEKASPHEGSPDRGASGCERFEPVPEESTKSERRTSTSSLQLSFATASARGLLDQPYQDGSNHSNLQHALDVQHSLVTDPVLIEELPAGDDRERLSKQQRSSDSTTAESNSGYADGSRANSSISKMPLSPSTGGTSIRSVESGDKSILALPSRLRISKSQTSMARRSNTSMPSSEDRGRIHGDAKEGLMETVRNLRKKPSRFSMQSLHFWKRSKSASPPMPAGGHERGILSSEDALRCEY